MKKLILAAILCFCFSIQQQHACTSIIISGKATPDGRPLMWKHRDTGAPYRKTKSMRSIVAMDKNISTGNFFGIMKRPVIYSNYSR